MMSQAFFISSSKVDWSVRCETPGGSAGQVRLLTAQSAKRLTARPPESEHPETEINYFQERRRQQIKNVPVPNMTQRRMDRRGSTLFNRLIKTHLFP
ncbi:hypothetical protein EJV22_00965 [Fictibacillus phosphorivorans]|nr:hypothetical protein [Fictibacillus phosphorivorans]